MRAQPLRLARVAGILGLLSIALFSAVSPGTAAEITYIYDSLGRLRAVVDDPTATNEVAIYSYDAVGNLTSIVRQSASIVTIIEVTPEDGLEATTVTIAGTGFSATASENTVSFNGTAATLVSASPTRLVTTVPTGATTGPVTVTTPTGTAQSPTPFSVGPPGGPTITGFSPSIGASGTAVTITGTNFDTLANTHLFFNARLGTVATATGTQLVSSVPNGAGSGRLMVATPQGQAVSTADFFVPPAPYTAANVAVTGRMAIGQNFPITFSTASKIALIVFDASAGQFVNLGISGVSGLTTSCCSKVTVSIIRPDGLTLGSVSAGVWGKHIDVALPVSGTYTIFVRPETANTGNVTLTLSLPIGTPPTPPLSSSDPPSSVNLVPGQQVRWPFSGTAGEWISVGVSNITGLTTSCCADVTLSVLKPDGSVLATTNVGTWGKYVAAQLPVTGTYTAVVSTVYAAASGGTLKITFSRPLGVLPTPLLSPSDPPSRLTSVRPGQQVRWPFTGTAGSYINVAVSGVSGITGGSCCSDVLLKILNPDGSTLASRDLGVRGGDVDPLLTMTGTHTVVVDTEWVTGNTGAMTVTLSNAITGSMSPTAPPSPFTLRQGQDVRLTFDGTAGRWMSVGVSGVTGINAGSCCGEISLTVLKPDLTTLATLTFGRNGGSMDFLLPVSGSYTVVSDTTYAPDFGGTLTLTLAEAILGTLAVNGGSTHLIIARAGQDGRFMFDGTAGQQVTVHVTNPTMRVQGSLIAPNGAVLASYQPVGAWAFNLGPLSLPSTGTYTVRINPFSTQTGALDVSVTSP